MLARYSVCAINDRQRIILSAALTLIIIIQLCHITNLMWPIAIDGVTVIVS